LSMALASGGAWRLRCVHTAALSGTPMSPRGFRRRPITDVACYSSGAVVHFGRKPSSTYELPRRTATIPKRQRFCPGPSARRPCPGAVVAGVGVVTSEAKLVVGCTRRGIVMAGQRRYVKHPGRSNNAMQLTKLRAAPVLRAEVPPCAPAGGMDGGTASQLIASVRPTVGSSARRSRPGRGHGAPCDPSGRSGCGAPIRSSQDLRLIPVSVRWQVCAWVTILSRGRQDRSVRSGVRPRGVGCWWTAS
jgi:hypothetical protein